MTARRQHPSLLWRLMKRRETYHAALITGDPHRCELRLFRNGTLIAAIPYPRRENALHDSNEYRRALQHAGWIHDPATAHRRDV